MSYYLVLSNRSGRQDQITLTIDHQDMQFSGLCLDSTTLIK